MGKPFFNSLFLSPLEMALIVGCGGREPLHRAGTTSSVKRDAAMSFGVDWPVRSRALSTAANSAIVTVTYQGQILATHTFDRPSSDAASTDSFLFTGLPAAGVTVTLKAYTQADGAGDLVGTTMATPTLASGQTSTQTADLDSVATTLEIASTAATIMPGGDLALTLTARDANGYLVPISKGTDAPVWSSSAESLGVVVGDGAGASLHGVAEGPLVVTATYKGLSATLPLTVLPVPSAKAAFTMPWTYGTTAVPSTWLSVVVKADDGVHTPVTITIDRPSDLSVPSVATFEKLAPGSYHFGYTVYDGPDGLGDVVLQDSTGLNATDGSTTPFTFGTAPFAAVPVGSQVHENGHSVSDVFFDYAPSSEQSQQIQVTAMLSDGTTADATNETTWSTDGPFISVSPTGLVTVARGIQGTGRIYGRYKGTYTTALVHIGPY